jgi:hemerythrin-like domain-containing protein
MIGEAFEEHHVVKLVMGELPELDPAADNFEHKMTVLKELVEHHVEEEEKEMFPMAEKKLGDRRSVELAGQMAGPKAA